MALAATTEWDVRTTGSDSNGGGFDTASAGTDGSQGAVIFAYTDLVISGATSHLASVARAFVSTDVGNVINITGGTGFTTGRYQVLSVSSGIATMDRPVGTLASTGGTGNLGGSLLTINAGLSTVPVAGNKVHIKAGTYTLTTVVTTVNAQISVVGYQTTHNDGGTKPLITTATNSTVLIHANSSSSITFTNLSFTNTASVRAIGIDQVNQGQFVIVVNCTFSGFTNAINATTASTAGWVHVINSKVSSCTGDGITAFGNVWVIGCLIQSNTGNGVSISNTSAGFSLIVEFCAIDSNGAAGVFVSASNNCALKIINCAITNNTGNGVTPAKSLFSCINSYFWANGGWGLDTFAGTNTGNLYSVNNAFGGPNVSGNRNNWAGANLVGPIIGDITLTSAPYTSTSNFALNSTAGGGALLKQAGFPGASPSGTGYIDVGPVQTTGAPGTTGGVFVAAGMDGGMRG